MKIHVKKGERDCLKAYADQTYKMAQKKGIEIHNLYDDEVIGKAVNIMLEEKYKGSAY